MFTVVKVREGLARNDYNDPGWFKHPPGTVAYEWKGATPAAQGPPATPATPAVPATPAASAKPASAKPAAVELRARKPIQHKH